MTDLPLEPLSKDSLAEQWFFLLQSVLSALQTAFRASGYTKEAVARRLGKDPAFINRCLRGAQNMTLRTMHELARAMNCRLRIELEPLDQLPLANNQPSPQLKPSIAPTSTNVLRTAISSLAA
jgi:hypothetical protein